MNYKRCNIKRSESSRCVKQMFVIMMTAVGFWLAWWMNFLSVEVCSLCVPEVYTLT